MAFVSVLVVIGSYSMKSSIFDVKTMIIFGIFGYICDKLDFNPAPIVLGMILGPMIDFNLRRTLMLNSGNLLGFVNRPLSLVLIALILLSFAGPLIKKFKNPQAGEVVA